MACFMPVFCVHGPDSGSMLSDGAISFVVPELHRYVGNGSSGGSNAAQHASRCTTSDVVEKTSQGHVLMVSDGECPSVGSSECTTRAVAAFKLSVLIQQSWRTS